MKKILLLITCLPFSVFGQETAEISKTRDDVISILTNNDHKEWHYQETIMENDHCKQGQTFTFFKNDSTISIKRCQKGEWVYQNAHWLLKYRTTYDWLILLNEEKYNLIFKNYDTHEELILRPTAISDKKGEKVEEIILIYDPDLKNDPSKPKKKKAKADY